MNGEGLQTRDVLSTRLHLSQYLISHFALAEVEYTALYRLTHLLTVMTQHDKKRMAINTSTA